MAGPSILVDAGKGGIVVGSSEEQPVRKTMPAIRMKNGHLRFMLFFDYLSRICKFSMT
jgi:hypothetical protein